MNPGDIRGHLRRLRIVSRRVDTLVRPLRNDPGHTAVLLDVDGTLAPIVPDPTRAKIPLATRGSLRRVQARYQLLGVVTGRRVLNAREIVGLDIEYSGNHGMERLGPGEGVATIDPLVAPWRQTVRDFVAADCATLAAQGVLVEDKEIVVTLHWRGARDEAAARRAAEAAADQARARGLRVKPGKAILEVGPPVDIDKGTAVRRILDAHPEVRRVVYAGDDRTDVDAMRVLGEMRRSGRLDSVVRVGVRSREVPAEVVANADVVVNGTRGVRRVLRALA